MTDGLRERLRRSSMSSYMCQGCDDSVKEEAAERIEALEAEVEQWKRGFNALWWSTIGVPFLERIGGRPEP